MALTISIPRVVAQKVIYPYGEREIERKREIKRDRAEMDNIGNRLKRSRISFCLALAIEFKWCCDRGKSALVSSIWPISGKLSYLGW